MFCFFSFIHSLIVLKLGMRILGCLLPFLVKNTSGGYVIDLMTCFLRHCLHVLLFFYATDEEIIYRITIIKHSLIYTITVLDVRHITRQELVIMVCLICINDLHRFGTCSANQICCGTCSYGATSSNERPDGVEIALLSHVDERTTRYLHI